MKQASAITMHYARKSGKSYPSSTQLVIIPFLSGQIPQENIPRALGQFIVCVDVVLVEELEDARSGDAVPKGDVTDVVQDPVARRPVEASAVPR